mgnify:CR=1 FL=1
MFTFIARLILRNRILILSILLLGTAFMLYQARNIEVSFNFSRLLPKNDTTQVNYDFFRETFDQVGNTVILAAEDYDVFAPENYPDWLALQQRLENIEGVSGVLSPINAFHLKRNDSLQKLEVVRMNPSLGQPDLPALKEKFYSLPFYEELLYSEDKKTPLMLVQVERNSLYVRRIVDLIEEIKAEVARFEDDNQVKMHASGLPYIRMANTKKVSKEIFLFIGLSLTITSLLLFFFLRSFRATLVSLVVVILGVCWTFGLIPTFGFTISMLSSLVPTLVIVIGVPNCIFLINKYHNEYKKHGKQIMAVQRVIKQIGAATLMTNTTTALGFAALILTDSIVLQEFGIVASVNILMVFVISIIVIPIFYSFAKPPKKRHYKHLELAWVKRFVRTLTHAVTHRRRLVYISVFILSVAAIYGTTKMYATGTLTEEYQKGDPLLTDLLFLEKKFKGVVPLEIIIDTKRKNGAQKSSTFKKLDELQSRLAELPHLSRSLSIADGLKFAKQGYYRGDPSFYSLPNAQERNFILSYLPREENNVSFLNSLVDSTGQLVRVSMQVEDLGQEKSDSLHAQIRSVINDIFEPERYDVIVTGASIVFTKGTDYLIKNLVVSLLLAIFVIAIIMALLFRSFVMVLVSLIPNLFPLLLTAGIMGFAGIPLKPSTILVFSIAFGISVDDTIHFLAKYRQELRASNWNINASVLAAIRETGVSMLYTSIILFFGFSVFIASSFGGTVALGILVSITLIIAMLSNLVLLPSLLMGLEKLATNTIFNKPIIRLYKETDDDSDEDDDDIDPDYSKPKKSIS